MFIETVPNRSSPPAVLLRESYRDEHGRAQKPHPGQSEQAAGRFDGGLRALLKGGTVIGYRTGRDSNRAFVCLTAMLQRRLGRSARLRWIG